MPMSDIDRRRMAWPTWPISTMRRSPMIVCAVAYIAGLRYEQACRVRMARIGRPVTCDTGSPFERRVCVMPNGTLCRLAFGEIQGTRTLDAFACYFFLAKSTGVRATNCIDGSGSICGRGDRRMPFSIVVCRPAGWSSNDPKKTDRLPAIAMGPINRSVD